MVFIIGGAYQGKLDRARVRFGLTDGEIENCTENSAPDFHARCLYKLEEYTLFCIRNGIDPVAVMKEHRDEWKDSVLICCDIFCGVVPLGADMRAWRDTTGRLCAYLSREAESVYRVFCGLEQKLK